MRLKNFICSLGLALLLIGILAGCGSTPSTISANTLTTSLNNSLIQSMLTSSSSQRASSVVVSVGQVPSHQAVGSMFTVLTTVKGMTLYVHEWQGTSGFSCDGACAKTWHPLLYKGTGTPTSTTQLPGKLSVGTDYLGRKMVFYQGYPLYTYVGDKKPGDFNAPLPDNSPWQPATPGIPTGL